MAIASTDIKIKGSTTAGSAGDSTAQTVAGHNLGKFMSSTVIADATLDNLFPDATGDENAASNVDYQCLFIHNSHATLTLQNAVVWCSADIAGGATSSIGLDGTPASAHNSGSNQAVTIADKNIAPSGVTFSAAADVASKAAGLSIGDLPAGECKALWIRRAQTNSDAQDSDGVTISVAGDTTA